MIQINFWSKRDILFHFLRACVCVCVCVHHFLFWVGVRKTCSVILLFHSASACFGTSCSFVICSSYFSEETKKMRHFCWNLGNFFFCLFFSFSLRFFHSNRTKWDDDGLLPSQRLAQPASISTSVIPSWNKRLNENNLKNKNNCNHKKKI